MRYVAVDDCGNVINPMIVDGQIHGGLAQGIGQALFEEAGYTADGQLETTSFITYLVPRAPELPQFELDRAVTPSLLNPLGVKGVGEAGTIAAPPAIMNAVHDAPRCRRDRYARDTRARVEGDPRGRWALDPRTVDFRCGPRGWRTRSLIGGETNDLKGGYEWERRMPSR